MKNSNSNKTQATSNETHALEVVTENMFLAGIFTIFFSVVEGLQYWSINANSIEEISLQIGAVGIAAFVSNCFFSSLLSKFRPADSTNLACRAVHAQD